MVEYSDEDKLNLGRCFPGDLFAKVVTTIRDAILDSDKFKDCARDAVTTEEFLAQLRDKISGQTAPISGTDAKSTLIEPVIEPAPEDKESVSIQVDEQAEVVASESVQVETGEPAPAPDAKVSGAPETEESLRRRMPSLEAIASIAASEDNDQGGQ